jgi:hypothetical protein
MSGIHESQAVLRQALESIDHIRQRMLWAGYVAVAATLGAFAWLDHVAKSNASERSVIMAAILALTCVIAWSTFALALLITRMTKRIIRAIDLASART